MSKITSWDKVVILSGDGTGGIYNTGSAIEGSVLARLVLWPEGAPDPSEVPHAGDDFMFDGCEGYTVRHGIPEHGHTGLGWCIRATDGLLYKLARITRIPDAPTVKIGEKTYNLADAVARCEPLEEVK